MWLALKFLSEKLNRPITIKGYGVEDEIWMRIINACIIVWWIVGF